MLCCILPPEKQGLKRFMWFGWRYCMMEVAFSLQKNKDWNFSSVPLLRYAYSCCILTPEKQGLKQDHRFVSCLYSHTLHSHSRKTRIETLSYILRFHRYWSCILPPEKQGLKLKYYCTITRCYVVVAFSLQKNKDWNTNS